jgi:hypothetical protein
VPEFPHSEAQGRREQSGDRNILADSFSHKPMSDGQNIARIGPS